MSKKAKRDDAAEPKKHKAGEPRVHAEPALTGEARVLQISRAIADPTRFGILRNIAEGNDRCGILRECCGVSAATLSHHLRELEKVRLVKIRREGRFLQAALDRKTWKQFVSELKTLLQ